MTKGYKVSDVKRQKRIGVAAENLDELIEKSRLKLKFNVKSTECQLFVAEDGTLVDDDDYLATLPSQTLLILLKKEESMVTEIDYFCNLIRSHNKEYIETGERAQQFLSVNIREKMEVLKRYIEEVDNGRTLISERTQDPEWFRGLVPSEKTKEQSMSKRVKERMLNYFYKIRKALHASDIYVYSRNGPGKRRVDQLLGDLRRLLESSSYNETYFNRQATENMRLCDHRGLFHCRGKWDQEKCLYQNHTINPYSSYEARIIFQNWNFDHKVELSRSIIPKVLEAIRGLCNRDIVCIDCRNDATVGEIDAIRYYSQIFTTENLKLVYSVCHSKLKHNAESGVYTRCKACIGDNINNGN